jgi:hypothetical protein
MMLSVENPWRHPFGVPRIEKPQMAAAHLPDVELVVRPDESHLGGFATADEALGYVGSFL